MVIVDRFCCCSLQKGGIIYGWLGIVGSVLHFLSSFRILGQYKDLIKEHPQIKYYVENSFSTQFSVGLVCTIAFVLLMIGSKIGNRYLLLPWLTMSVTAIVSLGILAFIIAPIVMATSHASAGFGGALFAIGLIGFALQLYLFVCVLSLFQQLRTQDRQKDIALPTVVHHVVTHTFAPVNTNAYTPNPVNTYAPAASTPYTPPFPTTHEVSVVDKASKV